MSTEPNKKSEREVKGFAGLSSMASEVEFPSADEKLVTSIPARSSPNHLEPSHFSSSGASAAHKQNQYQTQSHVASRIAARPSWSNWLFGIAVVVGLIFLFSLPGKNPVATSSSSLPSGAPSAITHQPLQQTASSAAPVPSRPLEEIPPVGSGQVLTTPQISYCAAQSIRLDAAKDAVNKSDNSQIDRFNLLVSDYNSRCSDFRYRRGALESARNEVERFRADYLEQGRLFFPLAVSRTTVTPPARIIQEAPGQPRPESRTVAPDGGSVSLTGPEQVSLEAACSSDKYLNGPAAYRACRERQIAQLLNGPRRPDLSGLGSEELTSIEAACSSDKYLNGPATYNRCLVSQLRTLGTNNRRPSLDELSSSERVSIEAVCSSDKYLKGPAAYNQCLSAQLVLLTRQPRKPNLSNLSPSQRQSVEMTCSTDKYLNGPAAYNDCLTRQLQQLR